jgi:hypothetical protein
MLRHLIVLACLLAPPAPADPAALSIAQDRYEVGSALRFEGPAVTDLFMGGARIEMAAPVSGSAHLAGRRVEVDADVAGDLFAAGLDVTVAAPVGGDANVVGYEVGIGPVAGNLRAGAEVRVGSVGGYALVNGQDVTLQGAIAGTPSWRSTRSRSSPVRAWRGA